MALGILEQDPHIPHILLKVADSLKSKTVCFVSFQMKCLRFASMVGLGFRV